MARLCTVCHHPKRSEIELSVANGVSQRSIALQYSVGNMAVQRHMASCIKQAAKEQQAARDEAKTLDVLAQLLEINTITLEILTASRADPKKHPLALQAIDRVQKQIELQAKLLGDLSDAPQVNVWLPAPWETIELAIAGALSPFPEAAIAVAGALARLEAGNAGLN